MIEFGVTVPSFIFRADYMFECPECQRRLKTRDQLRAHRRSVHAEAREKCPFCELIVPSKRRSQIARHIRVIHPEARDVIARVNEAAARKRADLSKRARVQCLLCSYAATRISNLARHYLEVHGYDKAAAEGQEPDPENPDGALCTQCGEHFVNRHQQIKHMLQAHTRSTGEQCLYCRHRYLNVEEHIEERHQVLPITWTFEISIDCHALDLDLR